jgi:hypothetical protein
MDKLVFISRLSPDGLGLLHRAVDAENTRSAAACGMRKG